MNADDLARAMVAERGYVVLRDLMHGVCWMETNLYPASFLQIGWEKGEPVQTRPLIGAHKYDVTPYHLTHAPAGGFYELCGIAQCGEAQPSCSRWHHRLRAG